MSHSHARFSACCNARGCSHGDLQPSLRAPRMVGKSWLVPPNPIVTNSAGIVAALVLVADCTTKKKRFLFVTDQISPLVPNPIFKQMPLSVLSGQISLKVARQVKFYFPNIRLGQSGAFRYLHWKDVMMASPRCALVPCKMYKARAASEVCRASARAFGWHVRDRELEHAFGRGHRHRVALTLNSIGCRLEISCMSYELIGETR